MMLYLQIAMLAGFSFLLGLEIPLLVKRLLNGDPYGMVP